MATNNRRGDPAAVGGITIVKPQPVWTNNDHSPRNPLANAAALGARRLAAGVFLWSRRSDSDQLESLADQIRQIWREAMGEGDYAAGDSMLFPGSPHGRTQAEIAEEALSLKEIGEFLLSLALDILSRLGKC